MEAGMRTERYLPVGHPLNRFHRRGSGLFGTGLVLLGLVVLVRSGVPGRAPPFGGGVVAVVCLLSGGVLLAAAARSGALASTVATVTGGVFLATGVVHLLLLGVAPGRVLLMGAAGAIVAAVVGTALVALGSYGRFSGGLAADNPFVRARHHEDPDEDLVARRQWVQRRLAALEEPARAEQAMAEGRPTLEQELMLVNTPAWRARRHPSLPVR